MATAGGRAPSRPSFCAARRGRGRPSLSDFTAANVVIHLAREVAKAKIYPAVDLRTSRSRLIETGRSPRSTGWSPSRCVGCLVLAAALWNAGDPPEAAADRLMVERARKLQNYFTQPFFVAEPYTHRPGTYVRRDEALRTCRDLGRPTRRHPVKAFYFAGGIEEIRNRAAAAQ